MSKIPYTLQSACMQRVRANHNPGEEYSPVSCVVCRIIVVHTFATCRLQEKLCMNIFPLKANQVVCDLAISHDLYRFAHCLLNDSLYLDIRAVVNKASQVWICPPQFRHFFCMHSLKKEKKNSQFSLQRNPFFKIHQIFSPS